ncbi:MAG: hypothetical protein WCJ64_05550 [Rhodospirillaceae bacterium]
MITVTAAGHAMLIDDPRATITAVVQDMPQEHQVALATALEVLIPVLFSGHSAQKTEGEFVYGGHQGNGQL